ncbi:MAG: hypothetical protein WCQ47_08500 [bacterium]
MKCFFVLLSMLFLQSCATTSSNTYLMTDNTYKTVARGTDKSDTVNKTVDVATNLCKKNNQVPAFMNDQVEYQGTMDEGTKKTLRQVSKGTALTGLGLGILSRPAGSIATSLGLVGLFVTDDEDYVAEVRYVCK